MTLRMLGALVLVLLTTRNAFGQDHGDRPGMACTPEVHAWVTHCAASQHIAATVASCPNDGLFVVMASVDPSVALRVEIARAPHHGFVDTGSWSVSPVGEFPEWDHTPPALRATFDHVVACVRAEGGPPTHLHDVSAGDTHDDRNPHGTAHGSIDRTNVHGVGFPWLLALALAAVVAARWRLRHVSKGTVRTVALAVGAWAATLGLRCAVGHPNFFHQNGQGPAWIGQIVTHRHHAYGPGFTELFGWVRHLAPDHLDQAVFVCQGALAALAPLCVWAIARAMGTQRVIATVLASGVAIDPSFVRGAQSESYYCACTSLLFLAVATLTGRTGRAPVRSLPFALTAVATGLIVAQAARIHPVCWTAAALVPLALFVSPGAHRDRVLRTLVATALIGAVVALTSGLAMRTVIFSDFGSQWMGRTRPNTLHDLWHRAWPLALVGFAAVALSRRPYRALPRVAAIAVMLLVMTGADIVTSTGSPVWILAAYTRLYLPALIAGVAAVLAAIPRSAVQSRALAVALAVLFVVAAHAMWKPLNRLPTDAIELDHALAWRDGLPTGAVVASVEYAGFYVLTLPIYSGSGSRRLASIPLDVTAPPPDLRAYGRNVFYYRASICSTPEARAYCAAVEAHNPMDPVVTYALPAIPSMRHLAYDTPTVSVGLYRVRSEQR